VTFQDALQAGFPVPVVTRALCLLPVSAAGRRVGVLTFDAASLGAMHLRAANVLEAARRLPGDVEVVLLECTNFPPHREAVARKLCVPVFDIWDAVRHLDDLSRRHE